MNTLVIYFLLANIGLATFYLFFRLFLHRDTFFREKRIALLVGIVFALSYPLVDVSGWLERSEKMVVLSENIRSSMPSIEPASAEIATTPDSGNSSVLVDSRTTILTLSWFDWAVWAYLLVAAVLLLRILRQFTRVLLWKRRCERFEWKGEHFERLDSPSTWKSERLYCLPEGFAPFSFFSAVFMNPEAHSQQDFEEIMLHERAHCRQGHTYDVLFGELICVCFWANPFAWLLKRIIRENLEYLADHDVLQKGFDQKNYQYHLLRLSCQRSDANLANHFNVSQLKKRIVMMNKKRTSWAGLSKYALTLPLFAALLLMAYACNLDGKKNNTTESTQAGNNQRANTKRSSMKESHEYNELANAENKTQITQSDYNKDDPAINDIERPKTSIIKTGLNKKALFQTWVQDPNGPTASFVLSEKSFYVADYDGDGSMPYELIDKRLKVYYNDFIQEGEIISVGSDTLKIKWKGSTKPTTYSVWKN